VLQQPFYSTEVLSQLIGKVETRFRELSVMVNSSARAADAAAAMAAGPGGCCPPRHPMRLEPPSLDLEGIL